MKLTQDQSKVEVKGLEAKHYDLLMNIITLGTYPFFIRKAIKALNLKEGDRVLDFGAGTGRNGCLILKQIKEKGEFIGIDIGEEMIKKFKKNCPQKNAMIINKRIDEPLNFKEEFDLVFISFVLHGFVQEKREIIIKNSFNSLKKGGRFAILDYNEFNVENSSFLVKHAIRKIECPLAEDFILRDWEKILKGYGFTNFSKTFFYKEKVRLLIAKK
jgi:demethylmenaquinone methyltransferase/2-methoxy-6-polyprenyl-1,4-benzoquinol methylase